jgi:hypothetical protein
MSLMFSLLPVPTSQVLADIGEAVSILISIPAADRLAGDTFKLAMFQTASFVLQTKALEEPQKDTSKDDKST